MLVVSHFTGEDLVGIGEKEAHLLQKVYSVRWIRSGIQLVRKLTENVENIPEGGRFSDHVAYGTIYTPLGCHESTEKTVGCNLGSSEWVN
jgi:hypothetical protein